MEPTSLGCLERGLERQDLRVAMPFIFAQLRPGCVLILLAFALIACQSMSEPRYLVTESPIDVGVGTGLCIAVDPSDQHGIWWWEPGASGCVSRSTGPGVFHAEGATVSQSTPNGPTALSFRLGTHSTTHPFIDVRLVVEDGRMRPPESGPPVSLGRRKDLDVPEVAIRGRRKAD
jgi:hypothetical protein